MFHVGLLIVWLCFISDILLIYPAVWLPVCLINLLTYLLTYLGAVGWATDRCDDAITLTASASPASTTLLRIVRCHTQSLDPR